MRLNESIFLVLLSSAIAVQAQTPAGTNATVRQISLDDCVRMAVEKNLFIRFERHEVSISRFTLDGSFGYYDPVFESSATRAFAEREGGFVAGGIQSAGSKIYRDTLDAGLRGLGPMGMSYSLGSDYSHLYGRSSGNRRNEYDIGASASLRQPLLRGFLTDAGRSQITISKKGMQISEWRLREEVSRVVRDVATFYYTLIATRDNVKVQRENVDLAQRLLSDTEKKVQVGKLARLDQSQAEANAAAARATLLAAQGTALLAANDLATIIGDNRAEFVGVDLIPTEALVAVPQTLSRQDSWNTALTVRPEYVQARLQAEVAGVRTRLNKNTLLPSLDLVGTYGRSGHDEFSPATVLANGNEQEVGAAMNDILDNRFPNWSAGAVFSVPLSRRTERSNYRVAREREEQTQLSLKSVYQSIMAQIEQSIIRIESRFPQIEEQRKRVKAAEETLDAGQKKLDAGTITFTDVVRFQADLTAARADLIRALADYNISVIDYHFAEGTLLDKTRVTVK